MRTLRERIHDEPLVLDHTVRVLQTHGNVEGDMMRVGQVGPIDGRREAERGIGERVEVEEDWAADGMGIRRIERDDGRRGAKVGWTRVVDLVVLLVALGRLHIREVEEIAGQKGVWFRGRTGLFMGMW